MKKRDIESLLMAADFLEELGGQGGYFATSIREIASRNTKSHGQQNGCFYFCVTPARSGTPLSLVDENIVEPYNGSNFIGILKENVVNIDFTRQHLNYRRNEVQTGGKVTVITSGNIVTDMDNFSYSPQVLDRVSPSDDGWIKDKNGVAVVTNIEDNYVTLLL